MSEALILNVVETGVTTDADALLSLGPGMLANAGISWQFSQVDCRKSELDKIFG